MSGCSIARFEVLRTPTACYSLMRLVDTSSFWPQLQFWNSLLSLYVHHLISTLYLFTDLTL